jgi:carboxyl-terminal processing protease
LLATGEWLTPNGRVIWHNGIEPNVKVSMPSNVYPLTPEEEGNMTPQQLQNSNDTVLLKALEILKNGGKQQGIKWIPKQR